MDCDRRPSFEQGGEAIVASPGWHQCLRPFVLDIVAVKVIVAI